MPPGAAARLCRDRRSVVEHIARNFTAAKYLSKQRLTAQNKECSTVASATLRETRLHMASACAHDASNDGYVARQSCSGRP